MTIAQEIKSIASDFDVVAMRSCRYKTNTASGPDEEHDVGCLAELRRWKCEQVAGGKIQAEFPKDE